MGGMVSRSVRSSAAALGVMAVCLGGLFGVTAPAYADCGDPGQPPCTGPVPSPDEVAGLLNQLTDPATPDPAKAALMVGGLSPDELSELDDHANQFDARGYLPINFVVSDIQPAANNYAGATVAVPSRPYTPAGPIVLVNQAGRWLITHDTAMRLLDALWSNANRPPQHWPTRW